MGVWISAWLWIIYLTHRKRDNKLRQLKNKIYVDDNKMFHMAKRQDNKKTPLISNFHRRLLQIRLEYNIKCRGDVYDRIIKEKNEKR